MSSINIQGQPGNFDNYKEIDNPNEKKSIKILFKDIVQYEAPAKGQNKKYVKVKSNNNETVYAKIEDIEKVTGLKKGTIRLKEKSPGGLSQNYIESKMVKFSSLNKLSKRLGQESNVVLKELNNTIKSLEKSSKNVKLSHTVINIKDRPYAFEFSGGKLKDVYYAKKEPLAVGGFGEVRLVKSIAKSTLADFVHKVAKITEEEGFSPFVERMANNSIENEFNILRDIHSQIDTLDKPDLHNYIQEPPHLMMPFYDMLEETYQERAGYMVSKYDYDLDSQSFFKLGFQERLTLSLEALQGLETLHDLGYVHGDLKPGNVCHQDGHLKLCDFGGARSENSPEFEKGTRGFHASQAGAKFLGLSTMAFCSPDELDQGSPTRVELSRAATEDSSKKYIDIVKNHDTYCMGLILLSNLGEKSLEEEFHEEIFSLSSEAEYFSLLSEESKILLSSKDNIAAGVSKEDKQKIINELRDVLDQKGKTEGVWMDIIEKRKVTVFDNIVKNTGSPAVYYVIEDMLKTNLERPPINECVQRYKKGLSGFAIRSDNLAWQKNIKTK